MSSAARTISMAILLGSLYSSLCSAQEAEEQRIPYTNPEYYPGDWVSYTCSRFVYNLAVAQDRVYFATTGGILRYDMASRRWLDPWTVSNGLPSNAVRVVAYDVDTGFVWCSTDVGVSFRNPTSGEWYNFYKDEFGVPWSDPIVSIGITPRWVVFESRGGRRAVADKFGNRVEPWDGRISMGQVFWFGERGPGVQEFPLFHMGEGLLFDPEGYIRDLRLREYAVTCAQEDAWSEMWVGTWGLGIGRADMRMARLEMLPFGLWSSEVRALAREGNKLWAAGFGAYEREWGITLWDMDRGEWQYYEARYLTGVASDRVLAIAVGTTGVYFGTDLGLLRLDRSKGKWLTLAGPNYLADDWVNDVVTRDGWVWVATRGGVTRARWIPRPGKADSAVVEQLDPENLRGVEAYDLHFTENLLWVATSEGVYVWDTLTREGGYISSPDGPVGTPILSVDSYGDTLWVAGWNGVEAYDMREQVWLGPPAGRQDIQGRIFRIRAGDTALWVGTDRGVYKLDLVNSRWRRFTVRDGLVGNRVYDILVDGNYVWFATNRGLTRFYWNNPYRAD